MKHVGLPRTPVLPFRTVRHRPHASSVRSCPAIQVLLCFVGQIAAGAGKPYALSARSAPRIPVRENRRQTELRADETPGGGGGKPPARFAFFRICVEQPGTASRGSPF